MHSMGAVEIRYSTFVLYNLQYFILCPIPIYFDRIHYFIKLAVLNYVIFIRVFNNVLYRFIPIIHNNI